MRNLRQVVELCEAGLKPGQDRPHVRGNWEESSSLARELGMGALAYRALKGLEVEEGALTELQKEHDRYVSLYLLNKEAYDSVIDAFAKAFESSMLQHTPVLLKGAHLRRTLYQDLPWARPMNDLDLLVHSKDLVAAQKVMVDLGFVRVPTQGPEYHRRLSHAESWMKATSERHVVLVDLHTRLSHAMRNKNDSESMHERAVQLEGSPSAWGLCPDHQIAHLALHLGHGFFRSGSRSLIDALLLLERHPEFTFDFSDPIVASARSSIYVILAAAGRLEFIDEHKITPIRKKLLTRLFPSDSLFHPKEGALAHIENLLRALALMEDPKRAMAYPAYLASVQIARRLGA